MRTSLRSPPRPIRPSVLYEGVVELVAAPLAVMEPLDIDLTTACWFEPVFTDETP